MSNSNGATKVEDVSIKVKHLSYSFQDGSPGLQNVLLDLPQGSRTLLIGGRC